MRQFQKYYIGQNEWRTGQLLWTVLTDTAGSKEAVEEEEKSMRKDDLKRISDSLKVTADMASIIPDFFEILENYLKISTNRFYHGAALLLFNNHNESRSYIIRSSESVHQCGRSE
jgi:hypothetical protein